MSPDQVNQIISLLSGLLTILVGALVRHYLPPRTGSTDESADDAPPPQVKPPPATAPNPPKDPAHE
ncbi:hypothetical protein [Actinomadura rayongensis]|uniref:Uncharacterized protein n=1 Tax=Actinomadura rayongensis TaxID=1429076 RepID=A0A6I4WHE4_9ACTN|nr:hypothetical protein [Actinomadura rayongensis]MXQ67725.1 hypothetical protein [Actinomadura rayongensis]